MNKIESPKNALTTLGPRIILILLGAFLGAGTLSIVLATHDPNVIHACVAQAGSGNAAQNMQGQVNDGSVRIVSSEADCKSNEYHITWNVQGPSGPPGPQGPQGPQGLQGPPGANGLACWDLNGNGLFDAAEDTNADGAANTLDCQPLNADKVDGFDAFANPVPNALLALNSAAQYPSSVIAQGPGSGLDADTVDGFHASDFSPFNHDHDAVYVNEGQVNSVTSSMLLDGSVANVDLADSAITGQKVANITRVITANLMGWSSEFYIQMAPGTGVRTMPSGDTGVVYTFTVPYDYAGGDLTIREWWRPHDYAGNAAIFRWVSKMDSGGQATDVESDVPFIFTPSAPDVQRVWTYNASLGINGGDIIWVEMARRGDMPEDTVGRLDLRAVAVEYIAEQ